MSGTGLPMYTWKSAVKRFVSVVICSW